MAGQQREARLRAGCPGHLTFLHPVEASEAVDARRIPGEGAPRSGLTPQAMRAHGEVVGRPIFNPRRITGESNRATGIHFVPNARLPLVLCTKY